MLPDLPCEVVGAAPTVPAVIDTGSDADDEDNEDEDPFDFVLNNGQGPDATWLEEFRLDLD